MVRVALGALIGTALMVGFYLVAPKPQDPQSIAHEAAKAALHDPASAQFAPSQTHASRDGRLHSVCGQIRGRNLFGVMAPYTGFVAIIRETESRPEVVRMVIEDVLTPGSFQDETRNYCRAEFRF